MISALDIYLFDLRGYLILEDAIANDHVKELNAILDNMENLKPGEWYGYVQGHIFLTAKEGLNLQQIYEGGEPFERLIDNPSWIDHVMTFVGGQDSFDSHHGPLFIDENFANIRGPGESIGLHGSPVPWSKRGQFHVQNQEFNCGQINILMALTDIGPDDGPTMVIPGSHKSNFINPELSLSHIKARDGAVDGATGAIEVHMKAGDALLFVDTISHGSKRITTGKRRTIVYRYGPSWGFFRHGYRPSKGLLDRLTPDRRKIVWPHHKTENSPYLI